MNMSHFSKLNINKIITNYSKLTLNFNCQRSSWSHADHNGFASETGLEQTTKYFDTIATNYLKAVDIYTLGLHRTWRKELSKHIQICDGTKILDAAAGTGLSTLKITMFDMNPHMMNIGRKVFEKLGYNKKLVEYIEGDLHKLPFKDGTFDTAMISFAIRPHVDFALVLKELNRILKPRGKIVVMDAAISQNPTFLQRLHIKYVQYIAPRLEKLILGNFGAGDYVLETLRVVIAESDVEQMLKNANFKNIEIKQVSLGLAEVTIAYKP